MSDQDDHINSQHFFLDLNELSHPDYQFGKPSGDVPSILPNEGFRKSRPGRAVTPDQRKILQKLYTQTRFAADPHQVNVAVQELKSAIERSDPAKPLPVPLQATLNAISNLNSTHYDAAPSMDMPEYLSTVPAGQNKCNAFVAWQYSKAGLNMGGHDGYPVNTSMSRKHYAMPSFDWAWKGGPKGGFSEVVGTDGDPKPWLRPGDVVAVGVKPTKGDPGGHTAMYIGGGLIVSAASRLPGRQTGACESRTV